MKKRFYMEKFYKRFCNKKASFENRSNDSMVNLRALEDFKSPKFTINLPYLSLLEKLS